MSSFHRYTRKQTKACKLSCTRRKLTQEAPSMQAENRYLWSKNASENASKINPLITRKRITAETR